LANDTQRGVLLAIFSPQKRMETIDRAAPAGVIFEDVSE
jgi:hypothetical protein